MTVGRMLAGAELLSALQESTDRSVAAVNVGGAEIKRVLLRMGAKRYTGAVERYLLEQIFQRMEKKLTGRAAKLKEAFAAERRSAGLPADTGLSIGIAEGTAAWLDVQSLTGNVQTSLDDAEGPVEGGDTVRVRARTISGDVSITRAN